MIYTLVYLTEAVTLKFKLPGYISFTAYLVGNEQQIEPLTCKMPKVCDLSDLFSTPLVGSAGQTANLKNARFINILVAKAFATKTIADRDTTVYKFFLSQYSSVIA